MRGAVALTLCMLLAGCVVPSTDATDPPQTAPRTEPPTPVTSMPTAQPEPEPEPEPKPDPEPEPSCQDQPPTNAMLFDVGPDVPDKDLALIRCGLANGQDFLKRQLGGGISKDVLAEVTVKIVATGKGDQEPGGGGSCCTALAESANGNMRPFFDVAHDHWLNWWGGWPADPQRETSVIHEYAHGWQNTLGCIDWQSQPLGFWMNEGIAMQVSYAAMIERGAFTKEDVLAFMESSAKSGDGRQWYTPLRQLESNDAGVWPGHIGHLAVEFAMNLESASHGLMSTKVICEEIAAGATLEEAFQSTFGTDMDSFYLQFEAWKAQRP